MSHRGSEWTTRASALLLLAVVVIALLWSRADVAFARDALDARARHVQRLEHAADRSARGAVPLDVADLEQLLAPAPHVGGALAALECRR